MLNPIGLAEINKDVIELVWQCGSVQDRTRVLHQRRGEEAAPSIAPDGKQQIQRRGPAPIGTTHLRRLAAVFGTFTGNWNFIEIVDYYSVDQRRGSSPVVPAYVRFPTP